MIAPEGLWFILTPAILSILFAGVALWKKHYVIWKGLSAFFLLVTLAMLFFFRDPERPLPPGDQIVSPADGTVLEIRRMADGTRNIAIFLSLMNVHQIRTPVSGKVLSTAHTPGKYHRADTRQAGAENEHITFIVDSPHGEIKTQVFAGMVARRIICHLDEGDEIKAGERVGFIRFGSRAEVYLPAEADVRVVLNQRITGGETVLAVVPKKTNQAAEPVSEAKEEAEE